MKRLKTAPYVICLAASLMMFAGGCNIFEFASDTEKTSAEKAEDAISKGDYAKARQELAESVRDSLDSFALYLNAKATLLDSNLDLAKLINLIEGQDNISSGDNLHILDTVDKMPDYEKTNWYRTNMEIRANLGRIWRGQTAGVLKKDDITLGYTVSNLMSGVLGLRDTNRDGVIDASDFQIDLAFIQNIGSSNTSGFIFDGAKIKDDQGNVQPSTLEGLTVFLGSWQQKPAASAKASAAHQYQPDDINPLIAFVMSLLSESDGGISSLFGDKDSTAYDVDKIKEQIDNVASVINYYWYHDGIDNDGDGRIDEEIIDGIDNDGDGLIDEDTGWHPSDPTNRVNTEYRHIWQAWNNR